MTQPGSMRRLVVVFSLIVALDTLIVRALPQQPWLDFTADGLTDFVLVRRASEAEFAPLTWWVSNAATSTYFVRHWGRSGDHRISGDFDGDGIADPAVFRSDPGATGFWILPSTPAPGYFVQFGQMFDRPVVGDYDGDGRADVAVYRNGTTVGGPSYWYYKRSSDGVVVATQWGQLNDRPVPGDYDGDGKNDFVVQRSAHLNAVFFLKQTTAGIAEIWFGEHDFAVPGDYDGDGKTDLATLRVQSPQLWLTWFIRQSSDGVEISQIWGASGDSTAHGDYDGDGKTDIAVFRRSSTPGASAFLVLKSTGGTLVRSFGAAGDGVVTNQY